MFETFLRQGKRKKTGRRQKQVLVLELHKCEIGLLGPLNELRQSLGKWIGTWTSLSVQMIVTKHP